MLTGSLSANAYTNVYDKNFVTKLSSTTWSDGGSGGYVYRSVPLVGSDDDPAIMPVSVNFVGTGAEDAALEYAVVISTWQNVQVQITDYVPSNTPFNITLPYESFHSGIAYRCTLYVRRVDGGRIFNDQVYNSTFTWRCQVSEEVEENTLPSDWFGTTTVTGYNPLETMTTISSDYYIDNTVVTDSLDIPPVTESAIGQIMSIVTRILDLPYLKFMLCFAVIVGLVAWFLH